MPPVPDPRRPAASTRGQAAVEFVALLPLLALVLSVGAQLVLAGDALWSAAAAARAAARAHAVGADARGAALTVLPRRLERALAVESETDGTVLVRVRVPALAPGLDLGTVSARAHFEPQS